MAKAFKKFLGMAFKPKPATCPICDKVLKYVPKSGCYYCIECVKWFELVEVKNETKN